MAAQNPSKIIVLDDHPMITDGVQTLLEDNNEFEIVGVVHNWEELISSIIAKLPDILILDLNIRGKNILDKIDDLQIRFSRVKILIFSSYNNPSLVRKALTKNINGYLLKDTTQVEMLDALERIKSGELYIGDRVAVPQNKKTILSEENEIEDQFERINTLTERELQIIRLMVEGCTNKAIAERLFISAHTVHTHRKNILRKLELHSASEVVSFAYQNKLV